MNLKNNDEGCRTRGRILSCIVQYINKHGYAPTVREICDVTGLKSTSTVSRQIQIMMNHGTLETDAPGFPRAIRVHGYVFVKVGGAKDGGEQQQYESAGGTAE